jgi:hypothetical protein
VAVTLSLHVCVCACVHVDPGDDAVLVLARGMLEPALVQAALLPRPSLLRSWRRRCRRGRRRRWSTPASPPCTLHWSSPRCLEWMRCRSPWRYVSCRGVASHTAALLSSFPCSSRGVAVVVALMRVESVGHVSQEKLRSGMDQAFRLLLDASLRRQATAKAPVITLSGPKHKNYNAHSELVCTRCVFAAASAPCSASPAASPCEHAVVAAVTRMTWRHYVPRCACCQITSAFAGQYNASFVSVPQNLNDLFARFPTAIVINVLSKVLRRAAALSPNSESSIGRSSPRPSML